MTTPDRRKTTRKLINQLAYVNLESNNGGIVLNVSEGGFCFQSVAPIFNSRLIDFWLSLPGGKRIAAAGELAWIDATGKNGGLRFTSIPDEVREQICDWAGLPPSPRPVVPVVSVVNVVPAVATVRVVNDELSPHPPTAEIAPAHVAPAPTVTVTVATPVSQPELGFAPATIPVASQAAPSPQTGIPAPPSKPLETALAAARRLDAAISAALAATARRMEKAIPLAVASARRTIAPAIPAARTAVQRAAKALSTASRAYSTRSYFRAAVTTAIILLAAVSLIQLGGLLAGKTLPRVVSPATVIGSPSNPSPEPPKFSAASASAAKSEVDQPENQPATAADDLDSRSLSPSTSRAPSDDEKTLAPARSLSKPSQPSAIVTKPSYNSTALTRPAPSTSPSPSSSPAPAPKSTSSSLPPSTVGSSRVAATSTATDSLANSVSTKPASSSLLESSRPSSASGPETAGALSFSSAASIYFEVGSFKDPMWADKANETLAKSGFHAIVIHKGRFWMSSYHVVVGPFANGTAAQTAFSDLESHGYKPRPAKLNR